MRIDNPQIFGGSLPEWTTVGTIQAVGIGGSTSAPTIPTNHVVNSIQYKQIGAKTHVVKGIYQAASSQTGGANGSGDYLFTLPYGLQFDSTVPGQTFYSSNPNTNDGFNVFRALPESSVTGGVPNSTTNAGWTPMIIPWDATRYRIGLFLFGNSTRCWGSGWFGMAVSSMEVRWQFTFQST